MRAYDTFVRISSSQSPVPSSYSRSAVAAARMPPVATISGLVTAAGGRVVSRMQPLPCQIDNRPSAATPMPSTPGPAQEGTAEREAVVKLEPPSAQQLDDARGRHAEADREQDEPGD